MRVTLVGGSGGFGRYHLQVWRKHPLVGRLTVVGRDRAKLDQLAAEFSDIRVTVDLAAAVAEADLVDICTPPDTHRALAEAALAAGRPAVVEKPPCRWAAEAIELAAAATAGETFLGCVQNMRYAPVWRRVAELVGEGVVGRPLCSTWPVTADLRPLVTGDDFRSDAARGGGCLLDGAFHYAYLIPAVLGCPVTAVSAVTRQFAARPPAGEDTALVTLELGDHVAVVVWSWAVPNPPRTPAATIIGDQATLLVPRSARQPIELLADRQTHELDLGRWSHTPRNDLANCLGDFLAAARSHTEPEATWAEAVRAQQVIEAASDAAATGRRVTWDAP